MQLILNGWEVMMLVSNIPNDETDFMGKPLIAEYLLPKLFSAFNELWREDSMLDSSVAIEVSEAECWLMRKYVKPLSSDPGGQPVGITLSRKLFEIILAYRFPQRTPEPQDYTLEGYGQSRQARKRRKRRKKK